VESISISLENAIIYEFLSNILQNQALFLVCNKTEITGETKNFTLSSICFNQINDNIQSIINNFQIILKGNQIIECNNILGSLISSKIDQLIGKENFIDFSLFEYPDLIIKFFQFWREMLFPLNNLTMK
jgi:hypothetical protein